VENYLKTSYCVTKSYQDLLISIVVSVYNEEDIILPFYIELNNVIKDLKKYNFEIIFVNDGSYDNTKNILKKLSEQDRKVKVLNFSRNFGHEAAMIAGIDEALGDFIICIDADLQHPPQKIKDILSKIEEGYEIINMVRISNKRERIWKQFLSTLFYKLINKISTVEFEINASDFFMISRRVAKILRNNYRDKIRFLRGYIQILGFKRGTITFHAEKRFAGESKYSFSMLFKFALGVIFTFSNLPLRIGLYMSLFSFFFGLSFSFYSIYMKYIGREIIPKGYTTIVVLISFFFSILFLIIGIIGEYLRMLFEQSKDRPIYIIESKYHNGKIIK